MKKSLLRAAAPLLFASFLLRPAVAQVRPALPPAPGTQPPAADDSLRVNLQLLPDTLVAVPATPLDSVKLAWLRTPPELRDLVGDRIGCLETDVPHAFNSHVMAFVRLFTERQRGYTQRVLERENLYFPLFEKYLAKYNLPTDLKYLAVVESALIPTAKSRVGATGLWQFMGPTANDLRLRRDDWVDERMDPEKATEAACKHLRYLYGVFHDWEMVLAAYNWGAGNMQRVARRTGKSTYWEVHPHLPAETRNYVPTFTAIMYTMKYAQQHQLHSPELRYQYAEPMDTLQLGGQAFDLTRLAQACGYTDSTVLLRLNPELRKSWLPAGYRAYQVKLPAAAKPALGVVDRETLLAYCRPLAELPAFLPPRPVPLLGVEPLPSRAMLAAGAAPDKPAPAAPKFRRVQHAVKRGETVSDLAQRYAVSTAQLRRWNNLGKSNSLASRRQVVVFVPAPAAPTPSPTTPTTRAAVALAPPPAVVPVRAATGRTVVPATPEPIAVAEAPSVATRSTPSAQRSGGSATRPERPQPEPATASAAPTDSVPATYLVRRGDFLEKIARLHNLSVAQLMAWNQLTAATLVPGQKLQLREPTEAVTEQIEATRAVASVAQEPARRVSRPTPASRSTALPQTQVHLVQPGDTLYNISRRYQGVTVEKLRELNNLQSDDVKPGQKLIVRS